jgi:hypothetical protein
MDDTWTLIEEHADSGVSLWRDDRHTPRWAACPAGRDPSHADSCIIGAAWRDETEYRARSVMADMISAEYAAARLEGE